MPEVGRIPADPLRLPGRIEIAGRQPNACDTAGKTAGSAPGVSMPRRKLDKGQREVRDAVRAFVKLDAELERILDRAAEIAKTVPAYTVREKLIAYAVAKHMGMQPSASENEIDRALRARDFGVGRPTLRATLADLKARGIVTNARVRQRGGTHVRWSIVPGTIHKASLYPLRRGSVNEP